MLCDAEIKPSVLCILHALIHFMKWFTHSHTVTFAGSFFISIPSALCLFLCLSFYLYRQVFAYIWLVTLITQIICWLSLCKDFIHKIFYEHFFGLFFHKCDCFDDVSVSLVCLCAFYYIASYSFLLLLFLPNFISQFK